MEGHQRDFEAHAGNEKHKTENGEEVGLDGPANGIEIEGATSAIDERNAIEQKTGREEGQQDELGTGLGALHAFLVVGNEGSHGD